MEYTLWIVSKLSRNLLSPRKFGHLESWSGNMLGGLRTGKMFLGGEAAAAMPAGEDYPESKSDSGGSWQIYFSLNLE